MGEIGLQDLIFQVKKELLAPNPKERARDPQPLFFIDNIELELVIGVSQSTGGTIKLSVLDFAGIGIERTQEHRRGHVVRISLSSLIPRDQIVTELLEDPAIQERIRAKAEVGFVKGASELYEEP